MKKRTVIFDTDPGIDDAIALGLALKCETMDIKLVTTVAGNVNVDITTRNALDLLNAYGRLDIPVAKGADKPLIVAYEDGSEFHGVNGLGETVLEKSKNNFLPNAVEEMKNLILNSEEKVTIIAVGPLTNIALLISTYKETLKNIDELIFMGGALGRGNKTPLVEYNMGADPHAAKIVFDSGLKMTMLGLEMGDNARINQKEVSKIDTPLAKLFYSFLKGYNGSKEGTFASIYDATAVAYFDEPSMYKIGTYFADVEIEGKYTAGATVIDYYKKGNMNVAVEIDSEKFRKWFMEKIRNY